MRQRSMRLELLSLLRKIYDVKLLRLQLPNL